MTDSTTSIDNLPTDPTGGGSVGGGGVNLVVTEPQAQQQQQMPTPSAGVSIDQATINQLINGLQQASIAGVTNLPSRDIPMDIRPLTTDPSIQPNFIPPSNNVDYINYDSTHSLIDKYTNKPENPLDNLYDQIQTPLLLAIMYFIFQLPVFKQMIFKNLSFLCNTDGNYNFNGYIFVSILFGGLYFLIMNMLNNFSKF